MSGVLQVVSADGEFNGDEVNRYMKEAGVDTAGQGYTIVAIMGPQSSGKSTLLNHLFGTDFTEMDALSGRHQTTRGIWLSKSPKISDPKTLVLDLEGSDGRERGEDDTSFERQSSLFALAVADIVLVNMWAKDVGRETGAGKPLLKTIFQVNLRLFQPSPGARRTVLLFVFRDKTKTPMEKLVETWETDLETLWNSIAKPPQYEGLAISDFFDVQYTALSNYEDKNEEFQAESVLLRRKFTDDDEAGYLREHKEKLPGSSLDLSMEKAWDLIRENRDLNLPAHRLMIAKIRCEELAAEQLKKLTEDAVWMGLAEQAFKGSKVVAGLGLALAALLQSSLKGYDDEAMYFDPAESASRRKILKDEVRNLLKPAFDAQLKLAAEQALEGFKVSMEVPKDGETFVQRVERCSATALASFDDRVKTDLLVPSVDWTSVKARTQLEQDLVAHAASLRAKHIESKVTEVSKIATEDVASHASPLFETPPADLWPRLSTILASAVEAGSKKLESAVKGYNVQSAEFKELREKVVTAARGRLLVHAKEAANTALPRIKDRFNEVFNRDEAGLPRTWSPSADVSAAATAARKAAAKLLSQLAVVRLDAEEGESDEVEAAVYKLVEASSGSKSATTKDAPAAKPAVLKTSSDKKFDILSAATWPNTVSTEDVLLTPGATRTVWRQFWSDSALAVQQALATQEANKAAQNRMPPVWAILAMIFLGFNEFVAVLRNPLLLLLIVIIFLFAKTVYTELDVEGEMQRGLLPGVMSLSAKFVPTVKSVSQRTIVTARNFLQERSDGELQTTPISTTATSDRHRVDFDDDSYDATAQLVESLRQRKAAATSGGGGYEVEMTKTRPEQPLGNSGQGNGTRKDD